MDISKNTVHGHQGALPHEALRRNPPQTLGVLCYMDITISLYLVVQGLDAAEVGLPSEKVSTRPISQAWALRQILLKGLQGLGAEGTQGTGPEIHCPSCL